RDARGGGIGRRIRRAASHREDAGAELPAPDRHGADRRRPALPHPPRLSLLRGGVQRPGGDAEPVCGPEPRTAEEGEIADPACGNYAALRKRLMTGVSSSISVLKDGRAWMRATWAASFGQRLASTCSPQWTKLTIIEPSAMSAMENMPPARNSLPSTSRSR